MAQLRRDYERFKERGYDVVAVGIGTPARAQDVAMKEQTPYTILGDWKKEGYAKYGLISAPVATLIKPAVHIAAAKSALRGHFPTPKQDDGAQLPGTFIIDPGGIIRFAKPAEHPGDIPSSTTLLSWIDANASAKTGLAATH